MHGERGTKEGRFAPALVKTGDGTYTAKSSLFDECYHSTKDGALRESLKKHVEPAFALLGERATGSGKREVAVLDICFGLGYNTLTTLYFLDREKLDIPVRIYAPEFDEALVRSLVDFPYPDALAPYKEVVEAVAATGVYEKDGRRVEVVFGDARDFLRKTQVTFDIVYQDAFSPKKNPLLWTKEYFAELAARLAPDAVVTTYSSATPVRMGMAENGLYLYQPPSARVRSGTVASPSPDLPLEPIDMALKKRRNPAAAPLCDKDFK
ncbi:tRNA (5-methylaminomethyl-2-thiouridine)(34)-methyltransferase MnmD [Hydrogenimonas sp.]